MDEAARATASIRSRSAGAISSRPTPSRIARRSASAYDSGNYARALDRVVELADYPELRREQAAARRRGEIMGIGVAAYVESTNVLGWESGVVRVERSGKVTAITGSSPHGQGHETTFAQIIADQLGVASEDVIVRHGDTLGAPQAIGTFGSRSAGLGGNALAQAATEVRDKGRRLAARLLEASPEDLQLVRGGFQVKGLPEKVVGWDRIGEFAHRADGPAARGDARPRGDGVLPPGSSVVELRRGPGRRARGPRHRPGPPRAVHRRRRLRQRDQSAPRSTGRSSAASPRDSARRCWSASSTTRTASS